MKYTPLPEVMEGKRVLLVDDSIVRATTLRELLTLLKTRGKAKEIHVRIASSIIAPCFYGIDMSTVSELFAPKYMAGTILTPEEEQAMADAIGATSLRYLPVEERCGLRRFAGDDTLPGVRKYDLSDAGGRSDV